MLLPSNFDETRLSGPEYGEDELKFVCRKFLIEYSGKIKVAYRDYKESRGTDIPSDMQRVINAIDTLPVSTASCERGFSKLNLICTSLRSS